MVKSNEDLMRRVRRGAPVRMAVAGAADEAVLCAVKLAVEAGVAEAILVGDEAAIDAARKKTGLEAGVRVVHAGSDAEAADTAAALAAAGQAQALMKGMVNTSDFLRGALQHLRTGMLLSHLAAFQLPGAPALVWHTDGGMNVAPSLDEKKQILHNAATALHTLGYGHINVACLAANEQVSGKMPATVDAAALRDAEGEFPGCTVEGPVALDVALSRQAAAHKHIQSRVSGKVDLFLMPNIEAGNLLGKALIYYAGAHMAGVVLGAACPIVLASRAESATGKLNSIALACALGA